MEVLEGGRFLMNEVPLYMAAVLVVQVSSQSEIERDEALALTELVPTKRPHRDTSMF